MSKELRPYQIDAIKAIHDGLARGLTSQALILPTGTGKTFTAVKAIKDLGRILWISHTTELIDQSAEVLKDEFEINEVGLIKADVFDINHQVVMGSAQTLFRRLDKIPSDYFDVVVADECFPAGTLIDGKPVEEIKVGDIVRSFNHTTHKVEYKPVIRLSKTILSSNLIEINFSNGSSFVCTENHPIYTKEFGYVTAKFILQSCCTKQMFCLSLANGKDNKKRQVHVEAVYSNIVRQLSSMPKIFCSSRSSAKNGVLLFSRVPKFNKISKVSNILCNVSPMQETLCFKAWENKDKTQNILFQRMSVKWAKRNLGKKRSDLSHLWGNRNFDWQKGIKSRSPWKKIYLFVSRLQKEIFFNRSKKSDRSQNEGFGMEKKGICENENSKSYVERWQQGENDCLIQRENFSFKRGERPINKTSNDAAFSDRFRYGICNRNIISEGDVSKSPSLLQSGLSGARDKISNRGRWENAQVEEMEVSGQEKDRDFEFVRVASCEIYKQGNRGECGESNKKTYVYNFEVEGNHNYFVENILVHNCDLFGSVSFKKSLDHLKPKLRLGLTATFFRNDGLEMTDIFEDVVYEYTMQDAIKNKHLTKPIAIKIKTSANLDSVKTLGGEFNQKELTEKVNTPERNYNIVNAYLEHGQGRQFIAFCCDIQHTVDLCEAFKEKGVNCEYVVSDTKLTHDRGGTIDKFKAGEIIGLTNAMILTCGFDHADTGCMIMACPTKSRRKFIQQLGRGFRLKSEEFVAKWAQNVIILDVVDGTTRHRLINTDELDADLELEDKIFISDTNRQKLRDAKAKREQSFVAVQRDKDEIVELFPLPRVKFIKSDRLDEPATPLQLENLRKHGYPVDIISYTKFQCLEIIGMQPAFKEDVENLKLAGYDVSKGVTRMEVGRAYAEMMKRDIKNSKK